MTALNSEGLEKIKLCPLCRHVAREADPVHSTEGQIDSGYGPLSFGVECGADLECGCKVEGFPDQASAIAAWNRRALPPVDGLEVVGHVKPDHPEVVDPLFVRELSQPWMDGIFTEPVVTLSQASSVIAGMKEANEALMRERTSLIETKREQIDRLTKERDEARADVARLTKQPKVFCAKLSTGVCDQPERISSLEEENKRLREALEPFDAELQRREYLAPGPDIADWNIGGSLLTLGDLLAARQALEDHNG